MATEGRKSRCMVGGRVIRKGREGTEGVEGGEWEKAYDEVRGVGGAK